LRRSGSKGEQSSVQRIDDFTGGPPRHMAQDIHHLLIGKLFLFRIVGFGDAIGEQEQPVAGIELRGGTLIFLARKQA
jgi:hypothetical protein